MAAIPATLFFSSLISLTIPPSLSSSIVEELNQPLPPDFHVTVLKNCFQNPSLPYCSAASADLPNIFKSTIVARHLCNESNNPNCTHSFTKVDLRSRPLIAPLYLSFNFFWKYCPPTISTLDLSNNSLKGAFPNDILYCTQIQTLDLSHNQFMGDVPFWTLANMTSLTFLNLSYNSFSRSNVSESQLFKRFNSTSFIHSGLLPTDHKPSLGPIILMIFFVILFILAMGSFGWLCLRRPDFLPSFLQRKHRFTPAMLKAATDGFSDDNLLGTNGRVEIYSGELRDRTPVVIEVSRGKISSDLHREFIDGCRVLVQLDHKNLVQVLGWCNNRELRAIVTRWEDGDSVEEWLLRGLPWKHRLKVLKGVVEAMCYLQDRWPQVGYDLRARSILMSKEHEPLISRFKVQDHTVTNTTKKVHRFGLFLLEVVTNRRLQEKFDGKAANFIEWMRLHYLSDVRKVIDRQMRKTNTTLDQAKQAIGIGLACIDTSGNYQVSLSQISDMISGLCTSLTSIPPAQHQPHEGSKRHQCIH
ncbi:hypothetical protein ACLOJK_021396 [Asimina triloba]